MFSSKDNLTDSCNQKIEHAAQQWPENENNTSSLFIKTEIDIKSEIDIDFNKEDISTKEYVKQEHDNDCNTCITNLLSVLSDSCNRIAVHKTENNTDTDKQPFYPGSDLDLNIFKQEHNELPDEQTLYEPPGDGYIICKPEPNTETHLESDIDEYISSDTDEDGSNSSFQNINILNHHVKCLRKITRTPRFYCDTCGKFFSYKSTLTTHIKNYHLGISREIFPCKMCNKSYRKKGHLDRHIVIQHKKLNVRCTVCKKVFKEKRALTIHIERVHSGNSYKYTCKQCNRKFKSIGNYNDHKANVHPSISDECVCDICGNVYKSTVRLRAHKNRVHSGYRFQCSNCKKMFKRSCHLKVHTEYHCT